MAKIGLLAIVTLLLPDVAFARINAVDHPVLNGVLLTALFSFVGIIIMLLTYRLIDWTTPGNLGKELTENKNVALALLASSMMLGVSIIIAAALLG